ncbi:MAG: type 4a pilus biogenesis protein PilO [Clostridia bacterium]|nr:type 4a pilus biogenesis protein PilO [Deltaproteobacteria bacterium]
MEKLIERYADTAPRERYIAMAAIVTLILAGFWYFFWSDQSDQIVNREQQYQSLERERIEKQAYVDNLAQYEARLNELQNSLNEAREQLPDDPDVPQLLAQLDNRARQAGLAISRFEPKGEKKQDFYAEINFDMDVRGSYHEIATFIDSVGKLDRIVNVIGISMDQPKTVNQKVVVQSDFTVRTYRFIDTDTAPKKSSK